MLTTTSITIIIIMMIIITILIFIDIIIIIIITATTTITISKLNFALYKQMYSYKKTIENPPVSGRTALVVIIGMATMTSPLALQTYFMRNCSS